MSALSDFLAQINEQAGYSTYEIARQANRQGHRISQSTVARYLSGEHPVPAPRKTLLALASAFSISPDPLLELGQVSSQYSEFRLPPEADALTDKQRAAIIGLIRSMVPESSTGSDNTSKELEVADRLAPDGTVFNPDKYQDHAHLLEKYGENWKQHYWELAAKRQTPGDDIEEKY